MRKNRSRSPSGSKASGPVRIMVLAAVILLAISLFVGYIWKALRTWDYFQVRNIVVKQGFGLNLDYLKGKNIFSINLAAQAAYVSQFYPDAKLIKLTRVLPDRIYVDVAKRTPVAAVKLYKYFAVDQDGLLFNLETPAPPDALPVITGLETKIFGPKPGKIYNTKELLLALQIIAQANKSMVLKSYFIKKVDAASPANLSVMMTIPQDASAVQAASKAQRVLKVGAGLKPAPTGVQYLEVKFGGANIQAKIKLLENIITQEKEELYKIKYIDLRFASPVIKFNDAKK
ncbi:MAG: hypothetical protein Q8O22_05170 [Candidatus Omnitrophota bacterium]|nr:hypothetical protein [Candidatus Omnitrophota bacterium]